MIAKVKEAETVHVQVVVIVHEAVMEGSEERAEH